MPLNASFPIFRFSYSISVSHFSVSFFPFPFFPFPFYPDPSDIARVISLRIIIIIILWLNGAS